MTSVLPSRAEAPPTLSSPSSYSTAAFFDRDFFTALFSGREAPVGVFFAVGTRFEGVFLAAMWIYDSVNRLLVRIGCRPREKPSGFHEGFEVVQGDWPVDLQEG